jgi:tetratricopeptide (TPR) repeat protein
MKNLVVMAVLVFVALGGCGKSGQQEQSRSNQGGACGVLASDRQTPNYGGLIEEYERALAEDGNNLASLIGLGNAHFDSGDWKQAIAWYEKALRIDPRNADVRTDMGTAYRNLGMAERAIDEYHRALKHEPAHLGARYQIGIMYSANPKNFGDAIHVWEEILKMAPNFPHADHIRSGIAAMRREVASGGK